MSINFNLHLLPGAEAGWGGSQLPAVYLAVRRPSSGLGFAGRHFELLLSLRSHSNLTRQ